MPKSKARKNPSRQERRQRRQSDLTVASKPKAHALSQSPPARAVELFEKFDGHAPLRNKLKALAGMRDDWAGIPMPLDGERLVIEPKNPYARLADIGAAAEPANDGWIEVNSWHCTSKRCRVVVMKSPEGRTTYGLIPEIHHLQHDLATLGCSEAWGIEQEHTALQLLGTLLRHRHFKQYLLTGCFLETSKRSGLTYLFRKLRPTVVIKADPVKNTTRILCTLCLHPIAYYAGSWAGAMCPTDDVIAHLMLMRGDEPLFWKRANHHPAWAPQSGL